MMTSRQYVLDTLRLAIRDMLGKATNDQRALFYKAFLTSIDGMSESQLRSAFDLCARTGYASGISEQEKSVRFPTCEDEAALMCLLGTQWLEANAPHRLRQTYKDEHARTRDEAIEECAQRVDGLYVGWQSARVGKLVAYRADVSQILRAMKTLAGATA